MNNLRPTDTTPHPTGPVQTATGSTGIAQTKKLISVTKVLRQRLRVSRANGIKTLYSSGKTLQEIGDLLHLSRERVRQILKGYITANEGGSGLKASNKRKTEVRRIEERRIKIRQHGTRSYYVHYGCRCDMCNKANTDTCRAYMQRRRNE